MWLNPPMFGLVFAALLVSATAAAPGQLILPPTGFLAEAQPVVLTPDASRIPFTTIPAGTRVRILSRTQEWCQIAFRDAHWGERVGYVRTEYVTIIEDDGSEQPTTTSPSGAGVAPAVEGDSVPPAPPSEPIPVASGALAAASTAGSATGADSIHHLPVAAATARRVSGAIDVDGRLSEETWLLTPPATEFLQRDPSEGEPASERTELRVAYDSTAVYIGIRLFDSNPAGIVRRFSRRDDGAEGDAVTIYLDPRHDHLTGAVFQVSAAGVQMDAIIYNDFETDEAWDAVWKSAVTVDELGWNVELEIPLSQLRFPSSQMSTWGINVERFIQRKNEYAWLEPVPKNEKGLASRMAHLTGIEALDAPHHVEILPYTAARAEFITAEPGDPFNHGSRYFGSLGVDLKWGLTSNLTLDATLNPDFGQVEVDPAVINLTEFETSFTEKRPFFLEGAQIFTNFGSIGTGSSPLDHDLFYSRRIGREPQGEADGDHVDQPIATTILGAAKLTGKTANGWSIGLMEAVTDRERARAFDRGQNSSIEIEPLTNYFVGRLVKEGRGGGSGVIATAVNRLFDGSEALASDLAQQAYTAGYDGHVFFGAKRDWVLSGVAVGSHVTGTQSAIRRLQRSSRRYYQRPDVSYVRLDPTATSLSGWTGGLHLRRQSGNIRFSGSIAATSPGFEVNDLGFQRRADETDASATVTWLKYTPDAFTRRRSLSVTKSWGWNFGRIKQSDSWSLSTSLTFPNYWYASARASFNATTFDDHLTRGGPLALRPRSLSISSDFGSDARKVVWIGSGGSYEQNQFGSWEGSGYASIRVRPSERVRLSAGPYFYRSHDIAQYVTTVRDALATDTFGNRYVFSNLEQRQFSLTTRADLSLSRDVSFQLYMEPFVGVGRYQNLQEFAAPATFSFLRYGEDIGSLTFDPEEALYTVDPDGPGPAAPFSVGNQDFNYKSLVIKAVFRWEWRPGSTLYLAWTQDRFDDRHPGDFNLSRDAGLLFRAPADDVFLVKLSYWFSR